MVLKNIIKILILFVTLTVSSQENLYSSLTIPDNLKQNANAVVRLNELTVSLKSSNHMTVREKRIITVLNKQGNKNIDAYLYYDNNVNIKSLEVFVFDAYGDEIKKIKTRDFKDVSAVDGGTLYSDSRVKYLEYTPINYPYTIEFTYEMNTSSTAFLPSFRPVYDYYVGVETSKYVINYSETLNIRKKENNIEGFQVKKEELLGNIAYEIKNLEVYKPEDFSPSLLDLVPNVLFTSKQFTLEGVYAEVENWNDFGKWMYQDLIKNTHDLPESTISKIKDLVKDETNNIDKAKKIYQFVQDKVRYISVQVGIGGWKPFNASYVDEVGYGDCKALTNYTMSLLKAVDIESNYTVIYSGDSQRSFEKDFAAMQGNHAILSIPNGNEILWLECTSQKLPFGFIGNFTDDRDALVITPEGGKILHTKKYTTAENTQHIIGSYSVTNDGTITANAMISSKGIQYDDKYRLESETQRDLDTYYKKRWKYINAISINSITINNDKSAISFIEDISFEASNYTKKAGNRMLLTINALNRNINIPDRYRDRKYPLKIKRGFIDEDEVEIKLPSDYKIESMPENVLIENKFGSYQTEIEIKNENTLIYKRKFVVNGGEFPKEDYDDFRNFYKEITKLDNSKIALIKIQP
jgi:transglutaminase-like putative cysteine protease